LHGALRLGHVHRDATSTWSTVVSYGSAPDPRQRPHNARSSAPVVAQRAATASGSAVAIECGPGATATTCSTVQRALSDADAVSGTTTYLHAEHTP
jgi:hypothetical protein